jgi:hypothetical protein
MPHPPTLRHYVLPKRALLIARRDRSFSESVFNSARAVRFYRRPIHVQPISSRLCARSILPKRVLPIARPESRSTVANGSADPSACARTRGFDVLAHIVRPAYRLWDLPTATPHDVRLK